MEAMLIRQIVQASGAFKGGEGPGSAVRQDQFVDALADAVARAGGIGLADQLVRSLTGEAAAAPGLAPAPLAPGPGSRQGPVPASLSGALPVAGRVTSRFGPRTDPLTGASARHTGVDVSAAAGTPIRAPAAGVVRAAGPRGGYGNAVEIDHGNGLTTLYAHASEVLVAPGQAIVAGQEIARVGSTGRSTGAHLHFEVRSGGRPVDPARVLKAYAPRAEDMSRSVP
jgi:murein DD-endopeptidase MepM/ murein hydrolase activator NlpD